MLGICLVQSETQLVSVIERERISSAKLLALRPISCVRQFACIPSLQVGLAEIETHTLKYPSKVVSAFTAIQVF